jgi:hypothetical protein
MRSGFTHVKLCLDCDQQIKKDNICGCPSTHNPFTKGALVTITADENGLVPISLEEIGRVGNGQYRIKGTDTWYSFDGHCTTGKSNYCRLRQDNDEILISENKKKLNILAQIKRIKNDIYRTNEDIKIIEKDLNLTLTEALKCEQIASRINPLAEGETARIKAEQSARRLIADYNQGADKQRKSAADKLANIKSQKDYVEYLNVQIISLNEQLKN